jgi:anti-sigma factor RsiW
MDHVYIDEKSLIDRYVRGTLPVEERDAFEAHFLDCAECLSELEMARSLREGIRIAASDQAVRPAPAPNAGRKLMAWRWTTAIAAACFVLALAPAILFYRQLQRSENREMAFARTAQDAERAFENAQRMPPSVYALSQSRGSDVARTVEIPANPEWIVFTLEMDATQFPAYSAELQDAGGKLIWRVDKIRLSSPDAIGISIPSTLLAPGEYTLTLLRPNPGAADVRVTSFSLRAVPAK